MALGQVLARLSVELGLDTAAFSTGSRKAGKDAKNLGDQAQAMGRRVGAAGKAIAVAGLAVAGAFVLGQLKNVIASGLEYASALGEQAQQLGISTKALQEYRFAASQTGISQDEMDKSLQRLTRSLGQAAGGAKGPSGAFAKLGIDVKGFVASGGDAGDLLPLIADGLAKLQNPAERAAVGAQILGKNFQVLEPLLLTGSKGINNLRDAAQKLGIVLTSEQIAKADDAADKLGAVKQVLEAKLAGVVADNSKEILDLANALADLATAAIKAGAEWLKWRRIVNAQGVAYDKADEYIAKNVPASSRDAVRTRAREIIDDRMGIKSDRTSYLGGLFTVRKLSEKPKKGGAKLADSSGLRPSNLGQAVAEDAGLNTAALSAFTRSAADADSAAGGLTPKLESVAKASKLAKEEIEELARSATSILDRLFPDQAANREYEEGIKALTFALDKGTISAEKFEEAKRRLSAQTLGGDATAGPGESVFEFDNVDQIVIDFDKIDHALGKFKGLHDTSAAGIEAANDRIGQSFAEVADRVLGSLQGLTSAIKGGGFLDILSAVLGLGLQLGGLGAFGKGIQTNLNRPTPGGGGLRIPGFAGGTLSAPRGLALVGERGPELVHFRGGERVFKNGDGPGGGRASTINVVPSAYFDVVVDGRVVRAAPSIMDGGARVAASRGARAQSRRLA